MRAAGRYVERHLQAEGVQDGLLAGGSGGALSDPAVGGGEGDQAVGFVARLRQPSLAAFSATRIGSSADQHRTANVFDQALMWL